MIAIACDHSALDMKKEVEALLDEMGLAYHDYGTYSTDSCDYPVFGARAAKAVASGECETRDRDLRNRYRDFPRGQ